jgi:hypothetical protein
VAIVAGLVTDLDGQGVGQRIKSLNARFRKAIRHRGHSPNEQSANPEVFAIVRKMRPCVDGGVHVVAVG